MGGVGGISTPRFGYETVAVLRGLEAVRLSVDQLRRALTEIPTIIDQTTISKASTFTNTEVNIQDYNLVQLSSDGNLGDITYNVLTAGGSRIKEVLNAAETPHFVSFGHTLFVTNSTAEAGKNVRVTKYRVPWSALAAIQHGTAERGTTNLGGIAEVASLKPTSRGQTVDWFASNITPIRTPSVHQLHIKIEGISSPKVAYYLDDSVESITDEKFWFSTGNALVTTSGYVFNIPLLAGQSYNIRQDTSTATVTCFIVELANWTA